MNRREAFKALVGLPAATTIERVPAKNLKPTDVIVIQPPAPVSPEVAKRLVAYTQRIWPDHKVLVIDPGMKLTIGSPPNAIVRSVDDALSAIGM